MWHGKLDTIVLDGNNDGNKLDWMIWKTEWMEELVQLPKFNANTSIICIPIK